MPEYNINKCVVLWKDGKKVSFESNHEAEEAMSLVSKIFYAIHQFKSKQEFDVFIIGPIEKFCVMETVEEKKGYAKRNHAPR